jgi:thiamine pyrophosphokinase
MHWFREVNGTGELLVSFHGGIVAGPAGRQDGTMDRILVDTSSSVTLLGGGEASAADLEEALSRAPVLVAADSGAATALAAGHLPEAVVGDLDSLSDAARAALPAERVHRVAEQDTTDFDKALRSVRAPLVLGLGFLGARLDHQLANFSVLARRAERRCILLGARDLVFAAPPSVTLDLPAETRLSLFPMAPVAGTSQGLVWPIAGIDFAPAGAIGTSNRVAAGPVQLSFARPGMLVILPRRHLDAAIAALSPGR